MLSDNGVVFGLQFVLDISLTFTSVYQKDCGYCACVEYLYQDNAVYRIEKSPVNGNYTDSLILNPHILQS